MSKQYKGSKILDTIALYLFAIQGFDIKMGFKQIGIRNAIFVF